MSEGLEKRNRLNIYLEGKLKEAEVTIKEMKESDLVGERIIAANNNLKNELAKKIEDVSHLEWANKEQARVLDYHGLSVLEGPCIVQAGNPRPMPLLDLVEKMRQSGIRKRAKIKARDERILQLLKAIEAEREEKKLLRDELENALQERDHLRQNFDTDSTQSDKLHRAIQMAVSNLENGANVTALNTLRNAL